MDLINYKYDFRQTCYRVCFPKPSAQHYDENADQFVEAMPGVSQKKGGHKHHTRDRRPEFKKKRNNQ